MFCKTWPKICHTRMPCSCLSWETRKANGKDSLTASPKAPKPKIATLDPACTLAAFHAAPTPNQVQHHIQMSKIKKTYTFRVSLQRFLIST